jgi:hypothetical protein
MGYVYLKSGMGEGTKQAERNEIFSSGEFHLMQTFCWM